MSTPRIRREDVKAAVAMDGFEDWKSPLDSTQLDRPAARPSHLEGSGRHAAVMVLLVGGDLDISTEGPELLLIRRGQHLRYHAGQIALPGGRQEPEESLLQTAIRETREEIGVSLSAHDMIGSLRSIYIPPSDFTLTPFVAWLGREPETSLQAGEVDELIRVGLKNLMRKEAHATADVVRDNGETIMAPCYRHQSHVIWGATALVLSELIERLDRLNS